MNVKYVISIFLFAALNIGFALENFYRHGSLQLLMDNDAFRPAATDGQYSNGVKLHYRFLFKDHRLGVFLGHQIHTPTEIHPKNYDEWKSLNFPSGKTPLDRPYSGLMYGGLSVEYFNVNNNFFPYSNYLKQHVYYEFLIGSMGKYSFSGPIQKNWHVMVRNIHGRESEADHPAEPLGWSDPDVNISSSYVVNFNMKLEQDIFNLTKSFRLGNSNKISGLFNNPFTGPGLSITNYNDFKIGLLEMSGSIGLRGRLGIMEKVFSSHYRNTQYYFGSDYNSWGFQLYGFFEIKTYGALYNRHLDNKIEKDLIEVDRYPGYLETQYGVVGNFKIFQIQYSYINRTLEIKNHNYDQKWHRYGRVDLLVSY